MIHSGPSIKSGSKDLYPRIHNSLIPICHNSLTVTHDDVYLFWHFQGDQSDRMLLSHATTDKVSVESLKLTQVI